MSRPKRAEGRGAEALVEIARDLAHDVRRLHFGPPVTHVYNPLEYASRPHAEYLRRFGKPGVDAVLLGMNPGPFGMAQTGVPFGEVSLVRDWLGILEDVGKPPVEHPRRPILGFECRRSEVSGSRLWGWARDRFRSPERFFEKFFVINYCPLVLMEATGKNRTPDKLSAGEREALYRVCDRALQRSVEFLQPRFVVGVGVFAESRALEALAGLPLRLGRILHPSPQSPAANRGWAEAVEGALRDLGIRLPGRGSRR